MNETAFIERISERIKFYMDEFSVTIDKMYNLKDYVNNWYDSKGIKPNVIQFLNKFSVICDIEEIMLKEEREMCSKFVYVYDCKKDNSIEVLDYTEDVINLESEWENVYMVLYSR